MPLIRSISGLRATLGDSLIPKIIVDYCSAFSEYLPPGRIYIGRDGRPSGEWIYNIASGVLTACGREVINLGVVPTPTVQIFTEKNNAAGGIVITASHNPEEWNGLKFLNSNGIFLDAEANKEVWKIVDDDSFSYSRNVTPSKISNMENASDEHIKSILELPVIKNTNVIDILRERNFAAVVDAVNSSGSVPITSLLAKLGCKTIPLYCDGTGIFPHTPEPLPENLTQLAQSVKDNKADIGIAVDPDADRLVIIDENGKPIGEEKTIALAVLSVLKNINLFDFAGIPKVVVNLSTTRLVEDITIEYGAKLYRSPVGEINVVNLMKEEQAIIGGEGSGGVILPMCHYGRDSLVGTALILSLIALENKSISEIVNSLPKYEMLKTKKSFTGKIDNIIDKLEKDFANAKITKNDGVRIDFDDSWVQLRSSNTEPIVRIIAEAKKKNEVERLTETILKFF